MAAALCAAIGCCGLAFATALVLAPSIWPEAARLAPKLAAQGVTPALAGAVGSLWIGLAIAITSERRAAMRFTGEEARLAHRVDRVIAEQTFVRTGLMEQRAETMSLRQDVTAVAGLLREEIARAQEARAAEANKEDGLFRVAASLDQLHAKLEERLPEGPPQPTARAEGLERALSETLARLEAVLTDLTESPRGGGPGGARRSADAPAPDLEAAAASFESDPTAAERTDAAEPESGEAPTGPDLAADREPEGGPTTMQEPELESIPLDERPSLGLLDAFDDFGEFDAARAEDTVARSGPGGPLPRTDPRCDPEESTGPGGPRLSPRVELP